MVVRTPAQAYSKLIVLKCDELTKGLKGRIWMDVPAGQMKHTRSVPPKVWWLSYNGIWINKDSLSLMWKWKFQKRKITNSNFADDFPCKNGRKWHGKELCSNSSSQSFLLPCVVCRLGIAWAPTLPPELWLHNRLSANTLTSYIDYFPRPNEENHKPCLKVGWKIETWPGR